MKEQTVVCVGCWCKAGTHEKMVNTEDGPMHVHCAKKRGIKKTSWILATHLARMKPELATTF